MATRNFRKSTGKKKKNDGKPKIVQITNHNKQKCTCLVVCIWSIDINIQSNLLLVRAFSL